METRSAIGRRRCCANAGAPDAGAGRPRERPREHRDRALSIPDFAHRQRVRAVQGAVSGCVASAVTPACGDRAERRTRSTSRTWRAPTALTCMARGWTSVRASSPMATRSCSAPSSSRTRCASKLRATQEQTRAFGRRTVMAGPSETQSAADRTARPASASRSRAIARASSARRIHSSTSSARKMTRSGGRRGRQGHRSPRPSAAAEAARRAVQQVAGLIGQFWRRVQRESGRRSHGLWAPRGIVVAVVGCDRRQLPGRTGSSRDQVAPR